MSIKLSTAFLTLLIVSTTAHAIEAAKPKAAHEVAKEVSSTNQFKAIEEARKEFREKKGVVKNMSKESLRAFDIAVKAYTDKTPGLSSNSLKRLLLSPELEYLQGKGIVEQVEALSRIKATGTKEQQANADIKLELMDLLGIRMTAKNFTSKEVEALRVLLSINLEEIPAAAPVIKAIVKNLRNGELSLEDSVKNGMAGMKGTLEDFINKCGKGIA
jgi:hypothetical protein